MPKKKQTQEKQMLERYRKLSHERLIIARRMISRYDDIRKLALYQYKYPQDTERYNCTLKWNDLIHEVLNVWDTIYPDRAQVIREYFGIQCKKQTAVQISMKRFMSENTVFKYARQFVADVAQGLTPSMLE